MVRSPRQHYRPLRHLLGTGRLSLLADHRGILRLYTGETGEPFCLSAQDPRSSGALHIQVSVDGVVQSLFAGKRIVVFSGGEAKGENSVFDDAKAIRDGGGNGSIIGRNSFQRAHDDALKLLDSVIKIYQGKDA